MILGVHVWKRIYFAFILVVLIMVLVNKEYRVVLGWGDEHHVKIMNDKVVVDDKVFKLDDIKVEDWGVLIKVNGHSYRVKYDELSNMIYMNGESLIIKSIEEKRSTELAKDKVTSTTMKYEKDVIMSPMPGRVVKILVKPGLEIKRGQPLIVIESMKMENIISSDRDGIIKEVLVSLGTVVNRGAPLIRFSS